MTALSDEQHQRIENRLRRIVDEVPGESGWWKGNGESFMDLGREMLRLGAGLTEIEMHLDAVYNEVAQEFGE